MKYFVLAVFLNYKNARVIFIFQNGFENWFLNVFGNWILTENFGNWGFSTIFEKKLFKVPAVSDSRRSVFSFSVRFGFYFNIGLSESKERFSFFAKFLIIHNISLFKFWLYSFLAFLRETYIYYFVLHKGYRFLLILF